MLNYRHNQTDNVHPNFQQMPYWDRLDALAAINRSSGEEYRQQFAGTPHEYGYQYQFAQNQAKQNEEFAQRARNFNMPQGNIGLLPRIGSSPENLAAMANAHHTIGEFMPQHIRQYLATRTPQKIITNFGTVSAGGGGDTDEPPAMPAPQGRPNSSRPYGGEGMKLDSPFRQYNNGDFRTQGDYNALSGDHTLRDSGDYLGYRGNEIQGPPRFASARGGVARFAGMTATNLPPISPVSFNSGAYTGRWATDGDDGAGAPQPRNQWWDRRNAFARAPQNDPFSDEYEPGPMIPEYTIGGQEFMPLFDDNMTDSPDGYYFR